MFFIFSKVLAFLAQPLAIISMLFIAGWLIRNKRWKKILLTTAFVIFFFCSNAFIATTVMRAWETPVTTFASMTKKYDYAIVLGGVTKINMKPQDRVYFNRGADRATHALQLYKLGIVKKIMVSGGSGHLDGSGVMEGDNLADFMRLAGVPDEDIIIENQSKNTHESAVFASNMLSKMDGTKEALLVTSGYHMPRSLACFKKAGVNVVPFAAEPLADEYRFDLEELLVPKPEAVMLWQTMIREWVGIVAYWFAGYI